MVRKSQIAYNSNKTISRGDFMDPARAFAGTGLILADGKQYVLMNSTL